MKCAVPGLAGTVRPVSWAHDTQAQGGVYCGRNARIKASKTQPDGMNRYGEKAALRPTGVETVSVEQYSTGAYGAYGRPGNKVCPLGREGRAPCVASRQPEQESVFSRRFAALDWCQ